jgi:TolB protein
MRILAALAAIFVGALIQPLPSQAAFPTASLTFIRDGDVWVSKGALAYQVTNGASASWPKLSPGAQQVAYLSHGDLWIADLTSLAAGVPVRQVTQAASAGGPAWSPDGQWLAYRTGDTHQGSLVKVPVAGGTPIPLTRDPLVLESWSGLYEANTVAWSPDGRYLAYPGGQCWAVNDECLTIYDLKTGREKTAAGFGGGGVLSSGFATTPAFSPDSRFLYFTVQTSLMGSPEVGPVRVMAYDRERRRHSQIGADGDSVPTDLGDGRFLVESHGELHYLQPDGRRTILGPGTQPHASY